jgi:peptidyl-prolyl cis-trans isomerase D
MKMRKHVGLIVVLIGLAIVSFLAMDALNSQLPIFNGGDNVGSVNGNSISYERFARHYEEIQEKYELYSGRWNTNQAFTPSELQQLNDLAWSELVEDELMESEYSALGLIVTDDEMSKAIFGNPTMNQPAAQEIQNLYSQFLDDGTGFNADRLSGYLGGIGQRDPNDPSYSTMLAADKFYYYAERDIRRRIVQQKYNELFRHSIYVTDWMAQQVNERQNQKSNIRYVMLPYASIPDSSLKPTDKQLLAYLNKHSKEYEQEPSRDIRFVLFDAFPTSEDTAALMAEVNDLFEKFRTTDSDSGFIMRHSEPEEGKVAYDASFIAKDDIDLIISDTLFTADIGTFFGPYEQNDHYNVTKLIDRQEIPDSIRVREVMLFFRSRDTKDTTARRLDSLIQLYRGGTPYDSLVQYTENSVLRNKNGELGWLKPTDNYFDNVKDSLFLGNVRKGDTMRINTWRGSHFYLIDSVSPGRHIGVRYANLQKIIEPSPATIEAANTRAKRFMSKVEDASTFDTVAVSQGLTVRPATKLASNAVDVPLIDVPARQVVKWAFNAEVGEARMFGPTDFQGSPKYVVAILETKIDEGVPELDAVREQVTAAVIREMKETKLSDDAETALAGSSTLEDVAGKLGVEIAEADGVAFEGRIIQGIGSEPEVAAAAQGLKPDVLSTPVVGSNGVFVFVVTARVPAPTLADLSNLKQQTANQFMGKLGYGVTESIRADADIKDRRYKFY